MVCFRTLNVCFLHPKGLAAPGGGGVILFECSFCARLIEENRSEMVFDKTMEIRKRSVSYSFRPIRRTGSRQCPGSAHVCSHFRQPTSQPTSPPTSQQANQPTSQPASHPASQLTNQPSNQPTYQPSNQSASQATSQPTSKPTSQPTSPPNNQPAN